MIVNTDIDKRTCRHKCKSLRICVSHVLCTTVCGNIYVCVFDVKFFVLHCDTQTYTHIFFVYYLNINSVGTLISGEDFRILLPHTLTASIEKSFLTCTKRMHGRCIRSEKGDCRNTVVGLFTKCPDLNYALNFRIEIPTGKLQIYALGFI